VPSEAGGDTFLAFLLPLGDGRAPLEILGL
jgi:hypothetical protein